MFYETGGQHIIVCFPPKRIIFNRWTGRWMFGRNWPGFGLDLFSDNRLVIGWQFSVEIWPQLAGSFQNSQSYFKWMARQIFQNGRTNGRQFTFFGCKLSRDFSLWFLFSLWLLATKWPKVEGGIGNEWNKLGGNGGCKNQRKCPRKCCR